VHHANTVLGGEPNVRRSVRQPALPIDRAQAPRAILRVTNDAVTLEDLESKNGTFVAGTRDANSTIVREGDGITVSRTLLLLERIGDLPSTATSS
jgi:hypothetical protein